MISRIGHSRGRPVAKGLGKCGAITRHSASVRSVWYRVTGRPEPDAAKAEAYFERALAVAGQQQAKSRELRAAMIETGQGLARRAARLKTNFETDGLIGVSAKK